jgi:hypothetical protein
VNECGLYDLNRNPRPVAAAFKALIHEFGNITALAHGEMFEVTHRDAIARSDI